MGGFCTFLLFLCVVVCVSFLLYINRSPPNFLSVALLVKKKTLQMYAHIYLGCTHELSECNFTSFIMYLFFFFSFTHFG